ncbi:MAG: hypothetical protein PUK76_05205 [Treponema sp.]|nr:hypothetical protein [Treponema sp.]MDY2924692.1 hypothetical protein [Treponema sp.]
MDVTNLQIQLFVASVLRTAFGTTTIWRSGIGNQHLRIAKKKPLPPNQQKQLSA